MGDRKKKWLALILTGILSMGLCACSENGTKETKALEAVDPAIYFDTKQEYTDWKNESPVYATLNGTDVQLSGNGASWQSGQLWITQAGTYVLEGSLQGSVVVQADSTQVRIVLNGVQIQAKDGPAISVLQADKVILSLEEGRENSLSDSEIRSDEEQTAVIYSKDDLIINGEGSLVINGSFRDGIKSNDDLHIRSGNLKIIAKDDGIIGKDSVVLYAPQIALEVGGDAIKASNDTDETKGYIAIQDGSYHLIAGNDGLQAETNLVIAGGVFELVTGGGSQEAAMKTEMPFGRPMQETQQTTEENTESMKGLKAGSLLQIDGGAFTMDACDDAIHSNHTVLLRDGTGEIKTGDDAVHADTKLHITGGEWNIADSYEGLESSEIQMDGGTVRVTARDDGVNVAGGNDGQMDGPGGMDSFRQGAATGFFFHDGYLSVNASGDGIDLNSAGEMNGGTLLINGPENNGNGSLDYVGSFHVNGGILVAAGSAGMALSPSESSAQGVITMTYSAIQEAGTLFSLTEEDGTELLTYAPSKRYQSVIVSIPQLKTNGTYQYHTGGSSNAAVTDGLYAIGGYQNAETGIAFTMESNSVYLNESGVTTQPQRGMGGQPGGGRGNRTPPEGMENMTPPENGGGRPEDRQRPEGMEPPQGMEMPEGMQPRGGGRDPGGNRMPQEQNP